MEYKVFVSKEDKDNDHIVNELIRHDVTVERIGRLLIPTCTR